ncbi:MAG TPA: DUF2157 domain-containing protein [Thermoanaerobaculia bacterium]
MLSLEPEVESLRPMLGDSTTNVLIARERRSVFSLQPEVRIAAWAGAVLLATAAGMVLKNNLDRIGPLALAIGIGVIAAACYAWVWVRRDRESLIDDYVLLLGALLVSADVAFIETQFKLFGDGWHRHFILLALVHGVGAYRFGSRTLLSLSIVALAAWMGIEQRSASSMWIQPVEHGLRALACAGIVVIWRLVDQRVHRGTIFTTVFEHFAANLALAGGVALMSDDTARVVGCLLTIAIAAGVIRWGFHVRREAFVLYAFIYAVIATDVLLLHLIGGRNETISFLIILGSMAGAIAALIAIHARFRESAV